MPQVETLTKKKIFFFKIFQKENFNYLYLTKIRYIKHNTLKCNYWLVLVILTSKILYDQTKDLERSGFESRPYKKKNSLMSWFNNKEQLLKKPDVIDSNKRIKSK